MIKRIFKKIKSVLKMPFKRIKQEYDCKRLKNKGFSIISNNCWGSFMYQHLRAEYMTPFVGLFLLPNDYIKLLENLDYYLKCDLRFTDTPKYNSEIAGKEYPVGLLDDIEIYFMHYKDEQEAFSKWNRRLKRLDLNNLFVVFAETKLCKCEDIENFSKLKHKNKICFTAKKYNFKNFIQLKSFEKQGYLSPDYMDKCYKYFNVVNWLNEG